VGELKFDFFDNICTYMRMYVSVLVYVVANLTCPIRMWHNQWLAKMAVAATHIPEWAEDGASCKFHVATTEPLKPLPAH